MAKSEVVFVDIHCVKTRLLFHQRYDFAADNKWVLTYGIKDKEFVRISDQGTGNRKKIDYSKLRTGPQYKCPYCGNRNYVQCGKCGKLTCYSGNGNFECVSCGNCGSVSGTIDSMEGAKGETQ